MMANYDIGQTYGCGLYGIPGFILTLIWWAVIIIAIAIAVRWALQADNPREYETRMRENDPALDLLRQRYARGEIDRREFDEKRRDLMC